MHDMLSAQPPARMVAGALAHLATHTETGCPRAAYLAAMLLEQVANDPEADGHLRAHARELVEILDRDGDRGSDTAATIDDVAPHAPIAGKMAGRSSRRN